jgi:release factor glutamine methyltransferase
MTIREAQSLAVQKLRKAGIDNAPLDAALLLAQTLHTSRAALILHDSDSLAPDDEAGYQALVARRSQGEPLAYIAGRKEFRALDFLVSPDTLIPRPDTETLVEAVEEYLTTKQQFSF